MVSVALINIRKLFQVQFNLVTEFFDVLLCFLWGFDNLELETFDLLLEGIDVFLKLHILVINLLDLLLRMIVIFLKRAFFCMQISNFFSKCAVVSREGLNDRFGFCSLDSKVFKLSEKVLMSLLTFNALGNNLFRFAAQLLESCNSFFSVDSKVDNLAQSVENSLLGRFDVVFQNTVVLNTNSSKEVVYISNKKSILNSFFMVGQKLFV
mmetsp:Transcript_25742/g.40160  ORF Transcript_25742/g.40160 Transcript_25742/m.40160 type:complete len:209 (+) Transcript_25742:560-1186(+)